MSRDIVVTIPASRLAAVEEEERLLAARLRRGEKAGRGGWQFYWTTGRLPKEQPRRIYFLWDGAVRAWHEVLSMVDASDCTFDRHVGAERDPGRPAIFMHPKINEIDPLPMKPFRGFRYFDATLAEGWEEKP